MKTCPTCQQTYTDEIESCPRDGSRLVAEIRDERECPYCAELILKKARVCKHCRRDVEPLTAEAPVEGPSPALGQRCSSLPAVPPQGGRAAAGRAPQFRAVTKSPGRVKFVVLGFALLAVIAAGIRYFSWKEAAEAKERRVAAFQSLIREGATQGDANLSLVLSEKSTSVETHAECEKFVQNRQALMVRVGMVEIPDAAGMQQQYLDLLKAENELMMDLGNEAEHSDYEFKRMVDSKISICEASRDEMEHKTRIMEEAQKVFALEQEFLSACTREHLVCDPVFKKYKTQFAKDYGAVSLGSECASEQPGAPQHIPTTGPYLTVIDSQWFSDEYGSRYIVGTVRNNSDKEFSWGKVEFNLYDSTERKSGAPLPCRATWRRTGLGSLKPPVGAEAAKATLKYVIGW